MSDKDHLNTGAFDGTGHGADIPEELEGLFDGFRVDEEHLLHLDRTPPQAYS
ncbi:hypothetical protein JIM95_003340 [Corynebacterium sp. CCM 8835]|uniref:Uncharacterized protein n=1 Tax=Corynebacterium antarcticum TaxID=2800405 RepID=A0A9Q4CBB3_9CORY|nr:MULTISPECIES: hypothetical protein [Corynebacterium]MBV7292254.1 hypothetical protein [Corynebacterium sp. TAE3-ERU16]MCK7641962.1 hypothetical protein [Corynebacterium antarcticum]MCK7659935.1 hypothetical protein [Corynebacterium antarcticum]MCL0245186.1 hypothetical protein [Corynebacterium antarcticum]MCX7492977.1 hypothetical protein [Corynebacterium antarcticum]